MSVDVREDHLEGLTKGDPILGITQLVWNSIDAEASEIKIVVVENGLGGVEEIRVEDDGHGMTRSEAIDCFSRLGGSWKRRAEKSKNGQRILHGHEGKGRWKAFTIGSEVVWTTVVEHAGKRQSTSITGYRDRPGGFDVSDPVETDKPIGTTTRVTIEQSGSKGLLGDRYLKNLTAIFALYMKMYPDLSIKYRGTSLDPEELQDYSESYRLDGIVKRHGSATLTIIGWSNKVKPRRGLFLCDSSGVALAELRVGIQASGHEFTAYILWDGFREMEDRLLLAENDPEISPLINAARDQMREHFQQRDKQHVIDIVQKWKNDEVYPYDGEPANKQDSAVRSLFDVVAVKAAPAVNSSDDQVARRLSLRLLREALEANPTALRRVLTEVLQLPSESLDELNELLNRTTLTDIIKASSLISERLDFIAALKIMVFDPESTKQLKERSQLHRILANETWVFGEEYALTVDDQSLTSALKKHIKLLGRDELSVSEPVLDEDGKHRILDLLLARSSPQARDRHEHLVVELKAPKQRIGSDEITQIEKYAFAVASDNRFNMTEVEWDFIVVSSDLDGYAKQKAENGELSVHKPGLIYESGDRKIRVWVKTWAQIISAAEHRHKFTQDALKYTPDSEDALAYLREVHAKYLPESLMTSTGD